MFRGTCGDYPVLTTNAQGLRVQRAPGISLRPLFFGAKRFARLGRIAPRGRGIARHFRSVIVRESRLPRYSNNINGMERSIILHGGPLIPSPTLHGALAANGLKGAYLIQIRRGHAAAYLQAPASSRSGSGLLNVPALNANLRSAIS